MKIQLNGRLFKFKKEVILIYLVMNGAIVFAQLVSSGGDLRIGETTVKIGEGANVALTQGLSVSGDALFWNNGSVYFNNDKEETLDVNTLLDGSGTYYIRGKYDYILKGSGAAISSMTLDGGGTFLLENDLTIVNSLNLEDGVIDVSDEVELKIQSTESDAVIFNNSVNNTSFIKRALIRNTIPGVEYDFPLGTNNEGFHPFAVNNVSSSGYVGVTFKPDFYDTWSGDENSSQLETVGGWEVTTDENNLSFIPALSLYDNSYGILEGNYNIFNSPEPNISSPEFSLDFNSEIQGTYLTTTTNHLAGTFAIASINTSLLGDEGVPVPELINFLVKDGTGRTTFEVPGLQNYKKVGLSVYSRFGNLVYQSSIYANDFDSRSYRAGTYFYELMLETKEGKKVLVRNIIEIMEHN